MGSINRFAVLPLVAAISAVPAIAQAQEAGSDGSEETTLVFRYYSQDFASDSNLVWDDNWTGGGGFGGNLGADGDGTGDDSETTGPDGSDIDEPTDSFINGIAVNSDGTVLTANAPENEQVTVMRSNVEIGSATATAGNDVTINLTEVVSSGQTLLLATSGGATTFYTVPPGVNAPDAPTGIAVGAGGEVAVGSATAGHTVISLNEAGIEVGRTVADSNGDFVMTLSPEMTGGELLAFYADKDGATSSKTYYLVPDGLYMPDFDESTDPIADFNITFNELGRYLEGNFWAESRVVVTDVASGAEIGAAYTPTGQDRTRIDLSPSVESGDVLELSADGHGSIQVTVPPGVNDWLDCYSASNAGKYGDGGECEDKYIVTDNTELRSIISNGDIPAAELFTGQVTSFDYVFEDHPSVPKAIENWQTKNVTDLERMFDGATFDTLDLSKWDLSSLDVNSTYTTRGMFSGATFNTLDLGGQNWRDATASGLQLFGSGQLGNTTGGTVNLAGLTINGGDDREFRTTDVGHIILDNTTLGDGNFGLGQFSGSFTMSNVTVGPQADTRSMFYSVDVSPIDFNSWDVSSAKSLYRMFAHAESTSAIDLSAWDTSGVTDFQEAFIDTNFPGLDLSGWDVSSGSNFSGMFKGASLGSATTAMSGWNMSNATDLSGMFSGASFDSLDLSNWGVQKVTSLKNFLSGVTVETIDMSGWATPSLQDMDYAFDGLTTTSIDLSGWQDTQLTSMSRTFHESDIGTVNISGLDTKDVTHITSLFEKATIGTLHAEGLDFRSLNSAGSAFRGAAIGNHVDLSTWTYNGFGGSDSLALAHMFAYFTAPSLDVSGWVVQKASILTSMFTDIDVGALDVSDWILTGSFPEPDKELDYMFDGYAGGSITGLSTWDTSTVMNMTSMFRDATSFNEPLPWDTSSVLEMASMFQGAEAFDQPLAWNTSRVTSMDSMFRDAVSFNQPLNWDTSSVSDMGSMFHSAYSFNQPLNWDTSSVTDMSNMFRESAYNQPIAWDTSSVTDMGYMFYGATLFNQPISFNTANVSDMASMFKGAVAFNQPLDFDTSNVRSHLMNYIFEDARSFNQDLSCWNVQHITSEPSGFSRDALSWAEPKPMWGQAPNTGCN